MAKLTVSIIALYAICLKQYCQPIAKVDIVQQLVSFQQDYVDVHVK